MLTCIWKGNGYPAGRSCEGLQRPVLNRPCFNNCTHGTWTSNLRQIDLGNDGCLHIHVALLWLLRLVAAGVLVMLIYMCLSGVFIYPCHFLFSLLPCTIHNNSSDVGIGVQHVSY